MSIPSLLAFAEVVSRGGFSPAARSLRTTRQAIHREIRRLEDSLDVRLLERTTRKVRPTEAGLRLFEHAERIRRELQVAAEAMRSLQEQPAGTLRLAAPDFLGEEVLGPIITEFLRRHPQVRVEAIYRLEREDFMGAELDVAVRPGPLPDSSLLARRLADARIVCCASPSYLDGAEAPIDDPADLARHHTLHYGNVNRGAAVTWRFSAADGERSVRLMPRLASTNMRVVREACIGGLGVARLPSLAVGNALRDGALVEVLAGAHDPPTPIHAVFSSRASGNPTLGAFLDLLQERLRAYPLG